jgi:hypothetical protein
MKRVGFLVARACEHAAIAILFGVVALTATVAFFHTAPQHKPLAWMPSR